MFGGDFRALLVGMTGHYRGDRTGERAAFVGIVRQTVTHAERAEIGKAKAKRAEDVGIFGDFLRRITGVVHENFLRSDVNAHSGLEPLDIEFAVLRLTSSGSATQDCTRCC